MKRLAIYNPWSGAPVYFKKKTTSTMEDARCQFESGCPDGTVVLTNFQTRGRGRVAERSWFAEAGRNLLFTLVLRTSSQGIGAVPHKVPLVAGLALALSVEHLYGLSVQLKWPNDLLVGQKKLAGILCEALVQGESLGLLIGIGLNCNQMSFPPELESRATSLARELGRRVSLPDLLQEVLWELKMSLDDKEWHAKVVDRLYGLNCVGEIFPAVERGGQGTGQRGIVLGLNPDGSLLFQPENSEPMSVFGGEIRFVADPEL